MPQISNLKLFFSTAPSSPFRVSFNPSSFSPPFLSKLKTPLKPFSIFTVVSSSARRDRNLPYLRSRNNSTLRQTNSRKDNKSVPMEETSKGSLGFNKKRAEGRDKNDKPKTLQLKVRKLNPVNTISYIQILGTGLDTQDTSPSVLLFFDKQRIIFNAGEGLQRYCTEHKIKLSKIDHIFHSRVCSETAGGLPGLLLTLAGMGEEGMSVNIWGPSDLKYLVDAIRSFIPTAAMVHTHSFGPTPNADGASSPRLGKFTDPIVLLDDEVVKLSAILVRPSCSVVSQQMNDDSTLSDPSFGLDEEIDELLGPPVPYSKNLKRGALLKPGDISVIYICELPEIKGKFDPSKAVALGLKPGPKYRDLQLGNSVMSDKKDIMVHPSDVLGPSVPGPIVLIVDCPTPSHLQELLSIESLSSYYPDCVDQQIDGVKSVNCIIHLSPSSITKTATYQKWMKRFGEAQHIMAGHEIKNIEIPILKASARVAARLNYLCPNFFPAPGLWSLEHLNNFVPDPNASSEGSTPKLCDSISAENLLKFHLRPYAQLGLDRSGVPNLLVHKDIINDLISEIPEITDSVARVSQLWDESSETKRVPKQEDIIEEPWMNAHASIPNINLEEQHIHDSGLKKFNINEDCHESVLPSCLENISREDMEIVLLGTGSSQPSKYRNVSSIYLNLFSKGGLLLDCGEGTLGQLTRRFGVKGADAVVKGLRCIWISHIHADHHTGLARILALRSELLRGIPHDPLLVIGPGPLKRFLDAYQRLEDIDMQFLDCKQTTEASWDAFENTLASNGTHSPPRSPAISEDVYNGDGTGAATQNIDTSLFAKGGRMQSYWKRPTIMIAAGIQHLKNLKKLLEEVGLEALLSVRVVHCPQAYGLVVKAAERKNKTGKTIPGWKLVYSGDTRPCQALIDASHGATVLIHEATFEDGMVEEAIARNHSTTEEAIKVGNSAGAYRIILTHFSQRYPKIPVFDETHMHKTCIGFDLMSINVADLPILPQVLPHLKLLFKNEIMADESDDVLAL